MPTLTGQDGGEAKFGSSSSINCKTPPPCIKPSADGQGERSPLAGDCISPPPPPHSPCALPVAVAPQQRQPNPS
uniref:Uncharacterized protein n=1 Tax=Leersia perrieri TaxID=77586 RepID=A0A0D9X3I2_9ORYZ